MAHHSAHSFVAMKIRTSKHTLASAILSAVCAICLLLTAVLPKQYAIWLLCAAVAITFVIGALMCHILSRRSFSTALKELNRGKRPRRRQPLAHKAEFLVYCDDQLTVIEDNEAVAADLRFIKQIKQDKRTCTLDQFIHPDDLSYLREQIMRSTFLVPNVCNIRMLAGNLSGDAYAECCCRSILYPYKNFTVRPTVKLSFTLAADEAMSPSRTMELLSTFSAAAWEYNIGSDTISYIPVSAQDETFHLKGRMFIRHIERSTLLHPDFSDLFANLRQAFIAGEEDIRTELKLMDASGDYRWYTLTGVRVFNDDGKVTGYIGQLRNTDNSSAGEVTTFNPDIDNLTGLLNRHGMERIFSRRIAEAEFQSCAFVLIDIDNFNDITARMGKRFTDALLVDIAGLIRRNIGDEDIACRITKDVFALLLINPSSKAEVSRLTGQISQAVTHVHLNHDRSESVTCCIGISYCGWGRAEYEQLYYQADTALAFARTIDFGSTVFYHEGLDYMISPAESIREAGPTEAILAEEASEDLITQAVGILSESRELSSSINIVLSLIGHRFGLQSCEILEFSDDYQNIYSTYRWNSSLSSGSEPVKCSVELIEETIMLDRDSEYYLCPDLALIETAHPDIAAFYRKENVSSFLHIPIRDGLEISGLICFGAGKNSSIFTNELVHEIVLVSKIMAGYIMRLRNLINIDRISTTDSLTGCMNMSRFIAEAIRIVRENPERRFVVVYSDIDRFKFINESFGYLTGDRVLIELSRIISDILGENEVLGRIDADKFITLLEFDDRNTLTQRLKSCDRRLSTVNNLVGGSYKIPLRCGIAHVDPAEEMTSTIDRANLARKSVKNIHISTYTFYDESMRSRILQQKEIEDVMQEALANGEFAVYLQPKFSLQHERIVGAEALVRWERPGIGVQNPNNFIPIFEDNGFVVRLDFYVLDKVCEKLRRDIDRGFTPYPISVNFSRLHLNISDFIGRIRSCIEKYRIDPKYLEIEITESALVGNEDYLYDIMNALHDIGLTVAMDDFGSGYSTLNLLKRLPVDVLKIDKAFFTGSGSERERLIIANVVAMAKSLDICVVSEGVETAEQADFLRAVNCDIAQGYLYAQPMDIAAFEKIYQIIQ